MNGWKQISWHDAAEKIVFDDELGFVRAGKAVSYYIGNKSVNEYYIEDNNGNKKRLSIDLTDVNAVAALFSEKLYDSQTDYYGRTIINNNALPFTVETIRTFVHYCRIQNQSSRQAEQLCFDVDKKNKDRLIYLRYVWICDEIQDERIASKLSDLKMPLLSNLKIGDKFFGGGGRGRILKFYPQPNENNLMFQAVLDFEGCNKTPFDVSFKDKIYVLPYNEQPISETAQFNENKNEIFLSPYAEQGRTWEYDRGSSNIHCVNVYWNKIPDAASYVVSLYKEFNRPYLQSVYHLKDYIVDRNGGFLAIENLLGSGYIITVKAENRNGEEIALSRGIKLSGDIRGYKQCLPQYFKE